MCRLGVLCLLHTLLEQTHHPKYHSTWNPQATSFGREFLGVSHSMPLVCHRVLRGVVSRCVEMRLHPPCRGLLLGTSLALLGGGGGPLRVQGLEARAHVDVEKRRQPWMTSDIGQEAFVGAYSEGGKHRRCCITTRAQAGRPCLLHRKVVCLTVLSAPLCHRSTPEKNCRCLHWVQV
jgi:hypothetical protein